MKPQSFIKKKYMSLIALLIVSVSLAQNGFNYKALITDNGNTVANQVVSIKFTVLENGTTSVYQETQTGNTDANGIIAFNIGEGSAVSGDFSTIDWSSEDHFLKVEINTGSGYQDFGTSELKSVPYAKYADKSGNAFSGDFNDLSNVPTGLSDGDNDTHLTETQVDGYVANNGYLTQVDNIRGIPVSSAAPTNGQVLKYNGSQFVPADDDTSGGSGTDGVVNSAAFSGTSTKTLSLSRSNGLGNITATFTDAVNDADHSTTNEIQHISKNGSTITLSSGGGSIIDTDTHLSDSQISAMGYIKSANDADHDATNEIQHISKSGSTVTLSNGGGNFTDAVNDADHSTTNELQNLTLSGTQLSISNGNHANFTGWDTDASDDFSGDYSDLTNKPVTFLKNSGVPTNINDDIYHTGSISIGTSVANSAAKVYVEQSGSDNTLITGIYSRVSNTGTGKHYGIKSKLEGAATGTQHGVYSEINVSGDGLQKGIESKVSGSGSGEHHGFRSHLSGSGTGYQTGYSVRVDNSGNSSHYGFKSQLIGSGTGNHYGTYNSIEGSGSSYQTGVYNYISNTGSGDHTGTKNWLLGAANGHQKGTVNSISNSGSGDHIGVYNRLSSTGTGEQYGTYNDIPNSGSGDHYGTKNLLAGTGSGDHYGTLNKVYTTGNGTHYGVKNYLSGGNGDKYGTYNIIPSNAGGTHYAVYGEAEKFGSYAGYFKGNIYTTKKLLAPDSGSNADLKPYMYGNIFHNGGLTANGAHTNGFTSTIISTGKYKITFTHQPVSSLSYTVFRNLVNTIGFIKVEKHNSYFYVYTYDTSGTLSNSSFCFIVYKN